MSSISKNKASLSLEELINTDRINCHVTANSKKRGIEVVSELISTQNPQLTGSEVFECLLSRERLGSTGVGHGVAIPHGRCKNITDAVGAFIHLERGVDYDAIDNEPVDLMFALIVPEESTQEHLNVLAQLAVIFKDDQMRKLLREAKDGQEIFKILDDAWLES